MGQPTHFNRDGSTKPFQGQWVKRFRVVDGAVHTQPGEPLPGFNHRPGVHHATTRHQAYVVEERDDAAPRLGVHGRRRFFFFQFIFLFCFPLIFRVQVLRSSNTCARMG